MAPPTLADVLEKNRVYAQSKHSPEPYLSEIAANKTPTPTVFIFACIDFRSSPEQFLDLHGNEAFVVRNLGGRVKAGIRELSLLEYLTHGQVIKECVIIHHTDCGLTHAKEAEVHEAWKAQHPQLAGEIDQIEIPTYDGSSIEKHKDALKEDLKIFKDSPFIRQELKDSVRAYVYDIKTGELIPGDS